jgi:hypothetical protein
VEALRAARGAGMIARSRSTAPLSGSTVPNENDPNSMGRIARKEFKHWSELLVFVQQNRRLIKSGKIKSSAAVLADFEFGGSKWKQFWKASKKATDGTVLYVYYEPTLRMVNFSPTPGPPNRIYFIVIDRPSSGGERKQTCIYNKSAYKAWVRSGLRENYLHLMEQNERFAGYRNVMNERGAQEMLDEAEDFEIIDH